MVWALCQSDIRAVDNRSIKRYPSIDTDRDGVVSEQEEQSVILYCSLLPAHQRHSNAGQQISERLYYSHKTHTYMQPRIDYTIRTTELYTPDTRGPLQKMNTS